MKGLQQSKKSNTIDHLGKAVLSPEQRHITYHVFHRQVLVKGLTGALHAVLSGHLSSQSGGMRDGFVVQQQGLKREKKVKENVIMSSNYCTVFEKHSNASQKYTPIFIADQHTQPIQWTHTHQALCDDVQGQATNGAGLGPYFASMHHLPPEVLISEERADPGGTPVPQTRRRGAWRQSEMWKKEKECVM